MDVLLDSNVYLEDTRMRGNHFAELFTYLRRTQSKLILPHVVQEEVLARYSDRLSEATEKARAAHRAMCKHLIATDIQFSAPNPGHEREKLLEKLRNPARGVRVAYVDEYAAIDVKEVVRRGIQRKRPANSKGEELRDVVLWLMALGLAKDYSGIAFISGDSGFASDDGKCLHPDLQGEVTSLNAILDFHRTTRDFIVAKALDHEILTTEQFHALVPERRVEELVVKHMIGTSTRVGTIESAEIREFEIQQITSYTVGKNAFFVEAQCAGSASLSVREFNSILIQGGQPLDWTPVSYVSNVPVKHKTPFMNMGVPLTNVVDYVPSVPLDSYWEHEEGSAVYLPQDPRRYLTSFSVGISVRTVDGHPESVESEDLRFKSFLPDDQQPSRGVK